MPKQIESFAHKVRSIMAAHGGKITAKDIGDQLDMIRGEYRRIHGVIADLRRAGEVERIEPGFYRYVGKPKQPDKRRVMWNVLRSRKCVTVEDLQELAGVGRKYGLQWLKMLTDKEVVRKLANGKYQLIKDTVQMPENDAKAAYLRELRRQKKAATDQIDAAMNLLLDARLAIVNIDSGAVQQPENTWGWRPVPAEEKEVKDEK